MAVRKHLFKKSIQKSETVKCRPASSKVRLHYCVVERLNTGRTKCSAHKMCCLCIRGLMFDRPSSFSDCILYTLAKFNQNIHSV